MNNKYQFQFHQPFYSEELQESRRGVSMPRKKNTFNVLMFIMILVTKEDNYLREVKEVYCFNVVKHILEIEVGLKLHFIIFFSILNFVPI